MAARSAARQPLPLRPWHHRRRVYLRRCVFIRRRLRGFAGPPISFLRCHSSPGDGSPSSPERTGECPYRPLRGEGTPPTSPPARKYYRVGVAAGRRWVGFDLTAFNLVFAWKFIVANCCGRWVFPWFVFQFDGNTPQIFYHCLWVHYRSS